MENPQASNLLYKARKYMKHTHKCHMQPWFDSRECTCGLNELLVEIDHFGVYPSMLEDTT